MVTYTPVENPWIHLFTQPGDVRKTNRPPGVPVTHICIWMIEVLLLDLNLIIILQIVTTVLCISDGRQDPLRFSKIECGLVDIDWVLSRLNLSLV